MTRIPPPEERANRTYSTYTTMTNKYCGLLSRIIQEIRDSADSAVIREKAFIAQLIAISAIETFYNAFFQVLVEEDSALQQHKTEFYSDLKARMGISKKVRKWPKLILGKDYDPSDPAIVAYNKLVDIRNHLTHFQSTYSTIPLSESEFVSGMADITAYEQLTLADAENARSAVEAMVKYVLTAHGVKEASLPWAIARWTFRYPDVG